MDAESMPQDLAELENRLRNRSDAEPAIDLRDRVMRAVAVELARPVRSAPIGRWDNLYWAAVAAGVLIVLNISMLFASQDEFSIWPAPSAHQMTSEIQAIQKLEAQQEGTLR